MQKIINLIEHKSTLLEKNSLCALILNEENYFNSAKTFSFTPSMLFFILGFRDVLRHLKYDDPQSEIELLINNHCDEDQNHWLWYLQDLKTLDFNEKSYGNDWSEFVKLLWDDKNSPTRDLVYFCIHEIKKHHSPEASLVIIECLESTFGVFMNTLKKRFQSDVIFKRLHFFGETHQEQEMNHHLGHWINNNKASSISHSNSHFLANIKLNDSDYDKYKISVEIIFGQFERVFNSWYENRNLFIQNIEIEKLTNGNTRLNSFEI